MHGSNCMNSWWRLPLQRLCYTKNEKVNISYSLRAPRVKSSQATHYKEFFISPFLPLPTLQKKAKSILLKLWISSLSWQSYQKKCNIPSGAHFPAAEVRAWNCPHTGPLTQVISGTKAVAGLGPKRKQRKNHSARAYHLLKLHLQQILLSMIPSPCKVLCHQKWYFCNSRSFRAVVHPREISAGCLQFQHVPKHWCLQQQRPCYRR